MHVAGFTGCGCRVFSCAEAGCDCLCSPGQVVRVSVLVRARLSSYIYTYKYILYYVYIYIYVLYLYMTITYQMSVMSPVLSFFLFFRSLHLVCYLDRMYPI